MTLRTAGLIAGVLGVILVAIALVAQWVKPAAEAAPSAQFSTSVVVVTPAVLALSPDAVVTIGGSGALAAHTARADDVDAWTTGRGSVTVTGLKDWDHLAVTTAQEPTPGVSPSPSASPSASSSPSASPAKATSPSASPSASGSASPSASPAPSPSASPLGSQDIWRDTAQQDETYSIAAADVPVGLTLVVEALDGGDIGSASLSMPRTIDDDWMTQVLWWGIGLSALGLIALIALFVDVRPAQSKGEEWLAGRAAIGSGKEDPKPGSRRARRAAGAAMPVATIPAEPTTGSIPIVEARPDSSQIPMVAVTGPVPVVSQPAPEPPPHAFRPPAPQAEPAADQDPTDDEEDRS